MSRKLYNKPQKVLFRETKEVLNLPLKGLNSINKGQKSPYVRFSVRAHVRRTDLDRLPLREALHRLVGQEVGREPHQVAEHAHAQGADQGHHYALEKKRNGDMFRVW